VQNSPISTPSSHPTVAKLLEVEADLTAQEAQLNAQLVSIQEKRHSLKTVIDMFAPGDDANAESVVTPAPTAVTPAEVQNAEVEAEPTDLDVTSKELDGAKTDTPADAQVSAKGAKRQTKTNSSPDSSKPAKKSAPAKKPTQQADTWQQYVIGEFSNAPLSEAIAQVMQQHSERVVEIATIIDTIFAKQMPQELRTTARERVSNVLSVGVKRGKWYRGQAGRYSMSKAAVVDDLIA
jgi:NAD(P)-dependent dehydrogenase (short-subunit alcohol dehydrogenase family)